MWPLIVLLFGVSCQPQSVAPQSFLEISSRNAEEVYLYAYGTPDGRVFDYTVPKAAFGKLPAWEVEKDPPPFAVARALEIAEKTSRGEHPEITEFMPANISLQRVGHDKQTRWFYVINMYPVTNGEPSVYSQVTAVVLMDGTAVKPRERSKPKL